MSSSATGVGMPICFLGAILLILTQKSSQKFGDVLGIMVSTDTPAPLQYNPGTGAEEPSNFAVAEYINTNSIPLNPNNVILPGEMAAKCAGAHYSEGHLGQIKVDGEDVGYDAYAKSVETVHKYKSFIGGSQTFGQDHFDAKEFCSALKHFLGMESDFEPAKGFDPNAPYPVPDPDSDPDSNPDPELIPNPNPAPEPPFDDDDNDNLDNDGMEDTSNMDESEGGNSLLDDDNLNL